jgi:ElaB/YqjD/DUF883 family membrane-anchored ribosome-binding protein
MRRIVLAVGIVVFMCSSVFSQTGPQSDAESEELKKHFLYEWTDNKGTLHITDALGKVPEQYRSQMRKREVPKGESPVSQAGRVAPSPGFESSQDDLGKAQWQSRLRDWKQRRENAEKRLEGLERERNELFRAWGSAALAPIENRMKAEKIEQQMKDVQNEIERAKNMIEAVIPEEARKAGVPPGWLRE